MKISIEVVNGIAKFDTDMPPEHTVYLLETFKFKILERKNEQKNNQNIDK